jgi:membrane protein YdbS with pleckstrin-like domain
VAATGEDLLQRARRLYESDRVDESEPLFRELSGSGGRLGAEGWYGLGLIGLARGDDDRAAESFKAAITSDPEHAHSLYRLGELAERRGSLGEARLYLERVLQLQPGHEAAAEKLRALAGPAPAWAPSPPTQPPTPPPTAPAGDYGAYSFLLGDDSPLARSTIEMIDRVRRDVRPSLTAYAGRMLAAALVALAIAFGASALYGRHNAFETVRAPNPNCDRFEGAPREQCIRFFGLTEQRRRVRSNDVFSLWPLILLLPLAAAGLVAARAASTRIEIDRGRVRVSRGVLLRQVRAVELFKVSAVQLRQGVLQRATGDGTLALDLDEGRQLWLTGVARIPELSALATQLQDLVLTLRRNRALQGIVL